MDSFKLCVEAARAPGIYGRPPRNPVVQIQCHKAGQQVDKVFSLSGKAPKKTMRDTGIPLLLGQAADMIISVHNFVTGVQKTEIRRHHCWTVSASQDVSTSASEETVEVLKQAVMTAVSNSNRNKDTTYQQRQSILQLIQELEALNPTGNPIDSPLFSGRWALLYTASVDEKTADKYAGTEEGPFLARVKPAALGSVRQIRSIQVIDSLGGTAENIADFIFVSVKGSLIIKGNVTKAAPMSKGAVRVEVTFENFVLKFGEWTSTPISLSWIKPKGWIDTTFLDNDMRIGRGDKGSIFVAVRLQQT